MNVAIDFDGTIADTNALKSQWIRDHLGRDIPRYLCDRTSCVPLIGEDAYNDLSRWVYAEEATLILEPVAEAIEALNQLAQTGDFHVITARDETNLRFAEAWLERHCVLKLARSVLATRSRSKEDVLRELGCDALVDDDARHLAPVAGSTVTPIEFKPGAPSTFEGVAGAHLCRSWFEIIQLLESR